MASAQISSLKSKENNTMQTLVTPMSCNALNIPMMHDKVVRLSRMEASLKHQLAGLSRERDKANLINGALFACLLYTSPSPRDQRGSRMPSSA